MVTLEHLRSLYIFGDEDGVMLLSYMNTPALQNFSYVLRYQLFPGMFNPFNIIRRTPTTKLNISTRLLYFAGVEQCLNSKLENVRELRIQGLPQACQ